MACARSTPAVTGSRRRGARGAAGARRARHVRPADRRGGWSGFASVRHWLAKYGLRTDPLHYVRRDGDKPPSVPRECPRHGWTDYLRSGARGFYRCPRCSMERVAARRRRIKEILVAEAGGRCRVCGYDIYIGALQFHHQDPTAKRFPVSRGGTTGSLDSMREEARKCVLLCANCHAEVEAGLVLLASPADNPG